MSTQTPTRTYTGAAHRGVKSVVAKGDDLVILAHGQQFPVSDELRAKLREGQRLPHAGGGAAISIVPGEEGAKVEGAVHLLNAAALAILER